MDNFIRGHMGKFYSQNGEDFLLSKLFEGREKGFFVEVGCIDGRRFSNTLHFEEKGWTGICVEAHPDYIALLKQNRSHSIVVHCAAGEKDEDEVTFYANSRGSLSTLDKSQEDKFRNEYGKYFTGFEEKKVSKRRLDSVFREAGAKKIDFLSIDIEGHEYEALKGIDFNKYRPAVLVIEEDEPESQKLINDLLSPHGYEVIARLANNFIYSIDKGLASAVDNKLFKGVELVHTQHPLDKTGDNVIKIDIDTRHSPQAKATLLSRIFSYGRTKKD